MSARKLQDAEAAGSAMLAAERELAELQAARSLKGAGTYTFNVTQNEDLGGTA